MIPPGIISPPINTVPRQIGSLAFWFDGQDPNGDGVAPLNNDSIPTWVDKSLNVISVTQATGSRQATFQTNIINGHSAMLFVSAAFQFYQRAAVRIFDNINNYSIYVVARPTNTAGASIFLEGGNGSATGIYVLAQTGGSIRLVQRSPYTGGTGGDNVQTATGAVSANNNFLLRFIRNGTADEQTVTSSNGVTNTINSLTQPALPATDMLLSIGVNGAAMTNTYCRGYIGEMLCFTKVLSASEEEVLFNYILQKWGITP